MKMLQANGALIPALGLGTFDLRNETCTSIVKQALDIGYRHIDTAAYYENEEAVGDGIRHSGVARDEIFLTTKVWPTEISEGSFQRSVEASLKRLDLDHVDLLLIHWPPKTGPVSEWVRLLNDAADRGWTKHIGVSNFTVSQLDGIVATSDQPITANQVEHHPYLNQEKVHAACNKHGVAFVAYSPLDRGGNLFREAVVVDAANAHGKTPAQIVLRWHMQFDGAGAIPKTATPERLKQNLDIFDFELSASEMTAITALTSAGLRRCDFEFSPDWD